jgi:hypothetical protein
VRAYISQFSPGQNDPVQKYPVCGFHSPVALLPSLKNPWPVYGAKSPEYFVRIGSHVAAVWSICY